MIIYKKRTLGKNSIYKNTGVIWEYKKENKKRFKQLSMHDTSLMEALYQEYLVDKGVHGVTDKCYMLDGKHQV